jgi:hypothetical protein
VSGHVEGDRAVTVAVSTELLAELREWSQPVEVQVVETPGVGTGWEMIFRRHECVDEASIRGEAVNGT